MSSDPQQWGTLLSNGRKGMADKGGNRALLAGPRKACKEGEERNLGNRFPRQDAACLVTGFKRPFCSFELLNSGPCFWCVWTWPSWVMPSCPGGHSLELAFDLIWDGKLTSHIRFCKMFYNRNLNPDRREASVFHPSWAIELREGRIGNARQLALGDLTCTCWL